MKPAALSRRFTAPSAPQWVAICAISACGAVLSYMSFFLSVHSGPWIPMLLVTGPVLPFAAWLHVDPRAMLAILTLGTAALYAIYAYVGLTLRPRIILIWVAVVHPLSATLLPWHQPARLEAVIYESRFRFVGAPYGHDRYVRIETPWHTSGIGADTQLNLMFGWAGELYPLDKIGPEWIAEAGGHCGSQREVQRTACILQDAAKGVVAFDFKASDELIHFEASCDSETPCGFSFSDPSRGRELGLPATLEEIEAAFGKPDRVHKGM